MAQAKAMTGKSTGQDNQPRFRSLIVNRGFSVTVVSSLLSLGIFPLLPWGSTPALSVDASRDRPISSLNISSRSDISTVSSPTSTGDITQPKSLNRPTADAQTVAQLPDILWDIIPADVLPPSIIPDGEFLEFLQDAGELLQTVSDRRGQYALITASALANDNPRLVSWLSQLQNSPIGTMTFSGVELGDFSEQLITTLNERNQAVDAIALQAQQESTTTSSVDFETLPDLREKGAFNVLTETIVLAEIGEIGEATATGGSVDLYVPVPVDLEKRTSDQPTADEASTSPKAISSTPAPVIVISHGVGGSRTHFSELANHLTSYGFVVVVPDHPPINSPDTASPSSPSVTAQLTQLGEELFGELNPGEFVQRPLTVSALLDELERLNTSEPMWMGRLDMDHVGIIGHSLGGYTGLALVSGDLNKKQVKRTCKDDEVLASNLSLVLQCQAEGLPRRLPSLEDERIKAVMALNPVASAVLGEKQIEDIEVPVMIVAGSHDAIAPMMSEQIPTFSWLTTAHKYLVTMVPAGHASVNLNNPAQFVGLSQLVSGPQQALGAEATQALSVAFMKTHLSNPLSNTETQSPYLNSAYGEFLSNRGIRLHLVTDLGEQL